MFVNAPGDAVEEMLDSAAEKQKRQSLNLGLWYAACDGDRVGHAYHGYLHAVVGRSIIESMETDPNVAEPAVVDHFYPMRRCIRESFEYQPVLMSVLGLALVVSVWLIGLRLRGCWRRAEPVGQKPGHRGWAEWVEFALGRLVFSGVVAHTCLLMIHLAYECSQGAALRRPFEALTSGDIYLFCTPLLAACVVYANCTVASLIGKMRGYFF